jgi:hypothetical protein
MLQLKKLFHIVCLPFQIFKLYNEVLEKHKKRENGITIWNKSIYKKTTLKVKPKKK